MGIQGVVGAGKQRLHYFARFSQPGPPVDFLAFAGQRVDQGEYLL
jgi:hypothetical protein